MTQEATQQARALLEYIDACPTPFHAAAETAARLEKAGYRRLLESERWDVKPGDAVYVMRGDTSIAAFRIGNAQPSQAGYRLIGAHTDSPNLRIKPHPEVTRDGYHQLAVETYGGVLLSTWLDRDLSFAGRIAVQREGTRVETHLLDMRRPLLRIPNLAIHLNRDVNTNGLLLNPEEHLLPIAGLQACGSLALRSLLAEELGKQGVQAQPNDVLSWDLCLYDVQASSLGGLNEEILNAPRLDNLASSHAGLSALLATRAEVPHTCGLVLYDHEEVGSRSAQGAASTFLLDTLHRLGASLEGGDGQAAAQAVARSFLISADMAHAVHPNYTTRHEPRHRPVLGGGPVIKTNVNQAYATDAESAGRFLAWCRHAQVSAQHFVSRNDMPCGGTIGPITAGRLGIRTIDVGNPLLAMHSVREMAATADVAAMARVLEAFYAQG